MNAHAPFSKQRKQILIKLNCIPAPTLTTNIQLVLESALVTEIAVQEMKFIIDTFIAACTVTHNVLTACRFLCKKDKKGQIVYKVRPLVEYAAFFWDPWQRVY